MSYYAKTKLVQKRKWYQSDIYETVYVKCEILGERWLVTDTIGSQAKFYLIKLEDGTTEEVRADTVFRSMDTQEQK